MTYSRRGTPLRSEYFTRKKCKEYLATVDNNLVASSLNLLTQFWTQFIPIDGAYEVPDELKAALPKLIEKFCVFAVLWGAGGMRDILIGDPSPMRMSEWTISWS